MIELTSKQQDELAKLATEYQSTSPRPANDGSDSVFVDCYDGWPPEDRVPKVTFRVAPSGFVQNLEVAA